MADITVQPERIKTIQKARKIGRSKLAKMSGLTERRLTKLETSASANLDMSVVERLANALAVPAPTLTGEFEIVDADLQSASSTRCSSGCCS
ncbi:MAG: helix-turn-helix domain-containing protein [Pseudomonadota bacterium]